MTQKTEPNQQGIQLPSELKQQIAAINARISNVNLANADLLREMDNTFKVMATTIITLRQENADLKAKTKETPKAQ